MTLDQYLDALGREAMPDYWQQMDLERRMWEEEEAGTKEYESWAKAVEGRFEQASQQTLD